MCPSPQASPFRHPGQPQGLINALPSREIHRKVAWGVHAIAADTETRIERKAGLRCCPCLNQLTDERQGGREVEMRTGAISVSLNAPAHPNKCFGVGALPKFGETDKQTPNIDECIAGGET